MVRLAGSDRLRGVIAAVVALATMVAMPTAPSLSETTRPSPAVASVEALRTAIAAVRARLSDSDLRALAAQPPGKATGRAARTGDWRREWANMLARRHEARTRSSPERQLPPRVRERRLPVALVASEPEERVTRGPTPAPRRR
ncbi:hypothetical protein HRbin40_01794 [bacterium HR40]|nr:hypothetical protein HRbin40_01794 [bacterium HR40]